MPTTARRPNAGEALRPMLPAGVDPHRMITLACNAAFLAREGDIRPGITAMTKTDPELTASLLVTLAALVDVDSRPKDMLAWLINYAACQPNPQRKRKSGGRPPIVRKPPRCGTADGYAFHLEQGIKPCDRCLLAAAAVLKPAKCGTVDGFDAHIERGTKPCGKCLEAAEDVVERAKSVRNICGSHSGYVAHKNRKEDVCTPCRVAQREYDAERYELRLKRQGKTRVGRVGRPRGTVHQMPVRAVGKQSEAA